MADTENKKDIDLYTLHGERDIIKAEIDTLNTKLNTLNKKYNKYNEYTRLILHNEVKNINIDDILKKTSALIQKYVVYYNKHITHGEGDTHRVFSDGTIEYCRNLDRGNWHTLYTNVFGVVTEEVAQLFSESVSSKYCDRYVTVSYVHAESIREQLKYIKKIYDYK
jgi:hypothetical protein